ncbi:MAG: hypothetical protein ACK5O7_01685 [Holosporales bacterium]
MASALLLSTLFWAENGFASEITETEEAPYFLGSLPRDAYLEVMKNLPSQTIARMGLASRDMRGVAEEGLTQLVEDMTLNTHLKAPVQWAV